MKKMIKLNNKGFALAEALVTAVFVMVIFSIIYTNYTPIMAEYERRETYDDIDGKYAAYWMKKMIEGRTNDTIVTFPSYKKINFTNPETACNSQFPSYKETCVELVKALEIQAIYITNYTFPNKASIDGTNPNLQDYLDYLPNYTRASENGAQYRVIVEMLRKNNVEATTTEGGATAINEVYAYSTIEVR